MNTNRKSQEGLTEHQREMLSHSVRVPNHWHRPPGVSVLGDVHKVFGHWNWGSGACGEPRQERVDAEGQQLL